MPLPKPTAIGVLNSIAEIGAAPVTVRNSTPMRPTDPPLSLWTSSRLATSTLSATGSMPSWCASIPVVLTGFLPGLVLGSRGSELHARDYLAGLGRPRGFGLAERPHPH